MIYAVVRLSIVIGVPAYFISDSWVASVQAHCAARPDLCIDVTTRRLKVGRWWYGYGFYFTARSGKAKELKALVLADMPDDEPAKLLSPWNYVGVGVQESAP